MSTQPCTTDELLATMGGEDLETYRDKKALKAEITAESTQFINKSPSTWPALKFNWDLSPDSQRYAMDGVPQAKFDETFPNGVAIVWVDLLDFDKHLCRASKRYGEAELWSLSDESKQAYLIAYLARGLPITPPMVAVTPTNEFHLQGGNHRYAVAKFSGELYLPIYMDPKTVDKASALVKFRTPH